MRIGRYPSLGDDLHPYSATLLPGLEANPFLGGQDDPRRPTTTTSMHPACALYYHVDPFCPPIFFLEEYSGANTNPKSTGSGFAFPYHS